MSYDYNDLVSQISKNRKLAASSSDDDDPTTKMTHLQEAVDKFSTLSSHCPMTPLLWMQYAKDTSELLQLLSSLSSGGNDDDEDPTASVENTASTPSISSITTRIQLLELGISEFPGCAILHLHYIQLLLDLQQNLIVQHETTTIEDDDSDGSAIIELQTKIRHALDEAIQYVGQGSHRNESQVVVAIYRIDAKFRAVSSSSKEKSWDDVIHQSFVNRAAIPMGHDVNTTLTDEYYNFCKTYNQKPSQEIVTKIELGRRYESKTYSSLVSCEDDIDIAMNNERILPPWDSLLQEQEEGGNMETVLDWETMLRENDDDQRLFCWMGFGGMGSSTAFHKYAQTCYRYRSPISAPGGGGDDDNDDEFEKEEQKKTERTIQSLASYVYERGVAECPTVESLWLSYIHHLQYLVQQSHDDSTMLQLHSSKLQNVLDRAIRNCPYSYQLVQQKLKSKLLLADSGLIILDPDELVKVIQETLAQKFITSPASCLELYMTAIEVIRRRILSLLAMATCSSTYDDTEPVLKHNNSKKKTDTDTSTTELDDSKKEEIQDLCEDLREVYDTTDTYLRKQHSKFVDGRSQLWSDRAITESMILTPLMMEMVTMDDADIGAVSSTNSSSNNEVFRCYEKMLNAQQPSHPGSYASYIENFVSSFPVTNSTSNPFHMVLSRLRQTRCLYQKALKSVGKPKNHTNAAAAATTFTIDNQMMELQEQRKDYVTSLKSLCYDYLLFEKVFGSDHSIANASKNVQKKLAKSSRDQQYESAKQSSKAASIADKMRDYEEKHIPAVNPSDQNNTDQQSQEKKRPRVDSKDPSNPPPVKKQKAIGQQSPASHDDTAAIKSSNGKNDDDMDVDDNSTKPDPPKPVVVHKVKVGKFEYPAHPFTVRISKLHTSTQDMDLVDALKLKCGAIVHARIMRERHQHHGFAGGDGAKGKSKGWALVQFEERESVEKALALSGIIGIHEKLIVIERSHMPAVALVPPGMHRINPKGGGKKSKFNQKRKEKFAAGGKAQTTPGAKNEISNTSSESPPKGNAADKDKPSSSGRSMAGILAFQPRGVQHSQKHRKVKVAIPKKNG